MARRRAAGLLLALAACIATATAAPTASNHTSLDLYDGAPDGCYYNFQHYGEGDRIMTNEPCLNCTCHNRMLMCYLKVCPFTKPIGQDCTIEKRADQCCPIVTCPDVPVDLLTSTTTSPAEYGPTGIGKLDKFGCSINGKYFSEGSKVPPTPNKPCEHCYCIRNMTTCVMQECTLHVDGCTPIYHKDVCCPVRYSCDHPEDEMPLLDDLSTTVRPTPGFLLTTTTVSPVTQMSQDCVYENQVFPDGALIKTEKACDHCYCMKGDIVCVVQECGTPMENEGKNCTALRPREGVCCPDTYICEGDEPTTETYDTYDRTTVALQEELTTLSPPRRTSSEGSGYRNEPDEPYTELPGFEPEIEGSGDEEEPKRPSIGSEQPLSATSESTGDILAITDDSLEYIPLTTTKPADIPELTTVLDETTGEIIKEVSQPQTNIPSTTAGYTVKESAEVSTGIPQSHEIGSGKPEEDYTPLEAITAGVPAMQDFEVTSDTNKLVTDISEINEKSSTESPEPVSSTPTTDERTSSPYADDSVPSKSDEKVPISTTIVNDISTASDERVKPTESNIEPESIDVITSTSPHTFLTTNVPVIEGVQETSESADTNTVSSIGPEDSEADIDHHITSPSISNPEDEYVTTESQELDEVTESAKESERPTEPHKHVTVSTPMLEEIEKDTTEYSEPGLVSSVVTHDDTSKIFSSTVPNIPYVENEITTVKEEHEIANDNILSTTDKLEHEDIITPTEAHSVLDITTAANVEDDSDAQQYSSEPSTTILEDNEKGTTHSDNIGTSEESYLQDTSRTTTISTLETEGGTTEPDKGLNTIPSGTLEEEISVPQEGQKTTDVHENFTTKSDLDGKFVDDIGTKHTAHPSISLVNGEESSPSTTESTFRREDGISTVDKLEIPESTTAAADITKDVMSASTQDYVKTTETTLDLQQETSSTSRPIYTDNIEETTLAKEDTIVPNYETSTEKELSAEEITTRSPSYENIPTTTVANQEDNEIFNEPRIPGEGDCLLNGITYSNESAVPSSNKCQSGCKCISSIIKCDPILCSLPPRMDNCETIYDSPDACCPTYVCDHKSETNPPQSQSQMSGTESPIDCHGDECVFSGDQKHPEKSSDVATECIGDKCTPVLCTDNDSCQEAPVIPCAGGNCNVPPSIKPEESESCKDGKECNVEKIPTKDCGVDGCITTDTQTEHTGPIETCTDKETCQNAPEADITALDQSVSKKCPGPECESIQTDTETSTASIMEHTLKEDLNKHGEKEFGPVTDISDKHEATTTMSSEHSNKPEVSELPASQETLPTSSDLNKYEIDITTKSSISMFSEEEYTTEELETKIPEETERPQVFIPISTETAIEKETKVPILDETSSENPEIYATTAPLDTQEIKTEQSELSNDASTTEKHLEVDIMTTLIPTMPSNVTSESHSVENVKPTYERPEESASEQPTSHSYEVSSTSSQHDTEESITVSSKPYATESQEISDSTTKPVEGFSTEPSKVHNIETQEMTDKPVEIQHDEITLPQEENITEAPKSPSEAKPDEDVKTSQPESETESPKPVGTEDQEDHRETTSNLLEDNNTETSTPADLTHKATETSTENIHDVVTKLTESPAVHTDSSEESDSDTLKTTITESQEITKSPEETAEKDYTTSISEEGVTKPTISDTTVNEIKKSPTELQDDITTQITNVEISTQSTNIYDTETKSPEKDITKYISEEPVTDVSKLQPTELFEVTESSTTVRIVEETETSKPSELSPQEVPISIEEGVKEDSTSKISDETMNQPSKRPDTESQEIPMSPDVTYQEDSSTVQLATTTKLPQTLVTESPVSFEELATTSKDTSITEPQKAYFTEAMDLSKSPDDATKGTTINTLEEDVTEPTSHLQTEPHEVSISSEEGDQKYTTTKISEEYSTELPKIDVTETHVISQDPEKGGFGETTIEVTDSATESPTIPEITDVQIGLNTEVPTQSITEAENEIGTLKPTVIEVPKEKPNEENKHTVPEESTTSQELLTTEKGEPTSPVFDSSRRTEPGLLQTEIPEVSIKEQTSTTGPEKDLETTTSPVTVDLHEQNVESSTDKIESEKKPELETQDTTLNPVEGEMSETQPGLQETISDESTEHTTSARVEISDSIDSQTKVPVNVVTDELTTVITETQAITTSKPTQSYKEPSDVDESTETQKLPPGGILSEGEKPEEFKTELPTAFTDSTLTTISEKEISSSNEPLTGEPFTNAPESGSEDKYSSETIGYDTTKVYINEATTTEQPLIHKTEETVKPVEESLITEKPYESSTELSDLETESQTQTSVQTSTESEKNVTPIDESIPSENIRPSMEDLDKDSPAYDQKPTSEDTTPKDHSPEGDVTTLAPKVPDLKESTTISDQKLLTESSTILPPIEITTETVVPVTSDSQESLTKDQAPDEEMSKEPSLTTEATQVKVTIPEDAITSEPEEEDHEVSKSPEIETEEAKPEAIPEESPAATTEVPKESEQATTILQEHQTISSDQMITEGPEAVENQPQFTPADKTDIVTKFEPITTPKNELPESTSLPLEDTKQTSKEDDMSATAEEHTTEKIGVTEEVSSSSEAYTEKQPELIHTPSDRTPVEQYLTTRKPYEPEVHETTTGPILSQEETTPSVQDISPEKPEEEQSIPVIVPDIEKASSPKEPDSVQTERVTPATEKPLPEITAPEEEFILATSKATTTIKIEEEVSTSSPLVESTAKSTEKVEEPMVTAVPEPPKPIPSEVQPTDDVPVPDEEGSFPPSGSTGYGQEPDYVEEDQTFGPGTCRYGGKVYVSAQQIPRDDPCDFCFCFRSDIICLQQSCPPPIHGCHEEPIQGFCCPRYECPVSMATTVNVTTTTTTTTTTLPPHFPTHSYKGSAQRRGCQIKGQTYKVGEVVRASSGPCLHCTCGGDGQMKCDPKVCTPEPMLRQMIAAAVSAKRRR